MSPRGEALGEALEAYWSARAREEIARGRGDPHARSSAELARRHSGVLGPRGRDAFLEAVERGDLVGAPRAATAAWLRAAHIAVAEDGGRDAVRRALAARVPYDSDHHRGVDLLFRLASAPAERERRGIAAALEGTWAAALRARRDGIERIEEAREGLDWLRAEAPPPDAEPDDDDDRARATLGATDDAFDELRGRVGHAAGARIEHYADLLFALRAPRWDDLARPRSRWRRVADGLAPLGLFEALSARARVEPGTGRGLRPRVLVITPGRDVRIAAGAELGLASEREAAIALGQAAAIALAHPGLPAALARPLRGSVPLALGYLLAHLRSDPLFVERAHPSLSAAQRRAVRELSLAQELFELRALAAAALGRAHVGDRDLSDAAREHLRRALGVDPPPALAALLALEPGTRARLSAARASAPLHVALRERFDQDYWRNPRAGEPIHAACARGGGLSIEALSTELDLDPSALGARMTELLA